MRLVGTTLIAALTVLVVVLAVANRQLVTVNIDPLGIAGGIDVTLPLFVVVFLALIFGVLLGGAARSLGRHTAHRRERPRPSARRGGATMTPSPLEATAASRRARLPRR